MKPSKYSLGLDIGTTSVGWAVIDLEKERIHDLGVRIFDAPIRNEDRREAASACRINKRRKQRLRHLKSVFVNNGLLTEEAVNKSFSDKNITDHIYALRAQAATEKISMQALFRVLYLIAERRGFKSNRKSDPNDNETSDSNFQKQLGENTDLLQDYKTIGQLLQEDQKYSNQKRNRNGSYLATFRREDLRKEAEIILSMQFKDKLEDKASQEKYRRIINDILDKTIVDDDNNKQYLGIFTQRPYTNARLLEKMTGFCEFEKTERRDVKTSYTAEEYVLLSALSNILLIDYSGQRSRLSAEDLRRVLALAKTKEVIKRSDIRKLLKLSKDVYFTSNAIEDTYSSNVKNANKRHKSSKDSDILNTELESAKNTRNNERKNIERAKVCEKGLKTFAIFRNLFDGKLLWLRIQQDPYLLDNIAYILSVEIDDDSIRTRLQGLNYLTEDDIEIILNMPQKLLNHFSGRSNLSRLAMRNITAHLKSGLPSDKAIKEAYNTQQVHQGDNLKLPPLKLSDFSDQDIETFEYYGINSKVTQRALSQSIKVVNALINKYGSPTKIHVELAREFAKTKKEKKQIERANERNRKSKQKYEEIIIQIFKDNHKEVPARVGHIIRKLILHDQQGGKDIYSGEPINISTLVLDESAYEIDHIIPRSKSFNNNMNNLALTSTKNNREKSNRLPLAYIVNPTERKDFLNRVKLIKDKQKRKNLMLNSYEDENNMTERALNDTKHISRFFKNYIQSNLKFAGDNSIEGVQRVFAIPGSVTAYLRSRWGFAPKDRDVNALHHAIDAAIVAATKPSLLKRIMDYESRRENGQLYYEKHRAKEDIGGHSMQAYLRADKLYRNSIDTNTGEIIDIEAYNNSYKIRQEHIQFTKYLFPIPWIDFTKEVSLRAGDIDEETLQNKLIEIHSYSENFRKQIHPIFISHMRIGKSRGSGHGATIYKKPYKGMSATVKRKSIYEISPEDIENSPIKDSDRKLYHIIKAIFDRMDMPKSGKEKDKRIASDTIIQKPARDPKNSPVVRKIPVYTKDISSLNKVRGGFAENGKGTVAYSILYRKVSNGHYKVTPVYFRQIHAKEKIIPDEGFQYVARMVPNDYIVINNQDGTKIAGYYKTRNSDTRITILPQQYSNSKIELKPSIASVKDISVHNISILGDNAPRS